MTLNKRSKTWSLKKVFGTLEKYNGKSEKTGTITCSSKNKSR